MTTATRILELLSDGRPRPTAWLVQRLRVPRSTVSQALGRMESRCLVRRAQRGVWALREWDPARCVYRPTPLAALPPMPVPHFR